MRYHSGRVPLSPNCPTGQQPFFLLQSPFQFEDSYSPAWVAGSRAQTLPHGQGLPVGYHSRVMMTPLPALIWMLMVMC